MANQQNSYTGSQGTGTNNAFFDFTFPSFTTSEVKVEVDNVVKTLTTHYTVENYNSTSGGKVKFTTGNIPTGTTPVRIFRQTNVDSPKATFTAGSSLKAGEINDNFKQVRHALQEAIGAVATDRKVQRFNIEADSIDGTLIADDVINSEHYVAGSIDHEHLANDIIDGDNIQDDVINSEHYAAASIDEEHIANSAVTQNKLANNSVGTPELINGSVTTDKLANNNVTLAKLGGGALPTDITVASVNIVNGTIATADIGGDQITNALIADNQIDSEHYVDGSIDHEHLANDIIDGDNIQDDVVNSEHIAAGALDNEHYAAGSITSDKLNSATVITASEQSTATANDTSFLTSAAADARFFNISSGDTIKDGQSFPDNDTTIATTAAINDRIIDLVDDVGGFVPIANETSFPTANPDVNNGAGTLVSIKAIGSTRTPSTGTVTIANGAGTGNTVTITGCGSTVLTAGFGVIVETTTTLHTYAFHRLVPKATEVTTVAGISSNVTTVATNIADINTVAADLNEGTSEIDTVATNIANVNTVGNAIANVNTTAGSIANVNTTAGSITNVNNVGNNISNVNSVAGNESNINSAVSNASNINSAVSNASNINTVAGSISNVNTAAGSISNVNTVASNISNVNNFNDLYQINANDPTTDGGGNALAEGDLYFNTSADRLKVYNGSSWVNGVEISGSGAVTTGNTFTGDNRYNDGVKALYGTGSDLEIFHDGTHSYIENTTGDLRITDTGGGGLIVGSNSLNLRNSARNENYLVASVNGAVDLYYDNSKKLETNSTGAKVYGSLLVDSVLDISPPGNNAVLIKNPANGIIGFGANNQSNQVIITTDGHLGITGDNKQLRLGASEDFKIYHNTSNYIDSITGHLYLRAGGGNMYLNPVNNETGIAAIANGAVELYHNNNKKLETTSSGISVTGNASVNGHVTLPDKGTGLGKLILGDGSDLEIYHDPASGGSNFIDATGSLQIHTTELYINNQANTERMIRCVQDGEAELYYNGSLRLSTTANGVTLGHNLLLDNATNAGRDVTWDPANDQLQWKDNTKASFGSNSDLQIYHDGSNSYIADVGTGELRLRGTTIRLTDHNGTENFANFIDNGATELFYDNAKKFETKSNGVTVSSSANAEITLTSATSGSATLEFGDTDDDDVAQISYNNYSGFMMYRTSDNADMRFYTNNTHRLTLHKTGYLAPATDSAYDLGTSSVRFANAYVDTYYGDGSNLTGINTDLVSDTSPQLGGNLDTNGNAILLGDTADTNTSTASNRIRLGASQDLQLFHGPNNSYIRNSTNSFNIEQYANATLDVFSNHDVRLRVNGGELAVDCSHNQAVELYYDNSLKLGTTSTGVYVYGDLGFGIGTSGNLFGGDNDKVILGSGSDFQLYHDGSHSYITNTEGILHLRGQGSGIRLQKSDGEPMIYAIPDGAVQLYYDQTEKAATASHGMYFGEAYLHHHVNSGNSSEIRFTTAGTRRGSVYADNGNTVGFTKPDGGWSARWHSDGKQTSHGHIKPNANNSYDLGDTSYRWRNIFTNDLHLSNEGGANDVDGTWGDWTIQEGESDLFLKNNRSGKKYKFNLMEVS